MWALLMECKLDSLADLPGCRKRQGCSLALHSSSERTARKQTGSPSSCLRSWPLLAVLSTSSSLPKPFINSAMVSMKPVWNQPPETGSWSAFPSAGPPVGHTTSGVTQKHNGALSHLMSRCNKSTKSTKHNIFHILIGSGHLSRQIRSFIIKLKISTIAPTAQ